MKFHLPAAGWLLIASGVPQVMFESLCEAKDLRPPGIMALAYRECPPPQRHGHEVEYFLGPAVVTSVQTTHASTSSRASSWPMSPTAVVSTSSGPA